MGKFVASAKFAAAIVRRDDFRAALAVRTPATASSAKFAVISAVEIRLTRLVVVVIVSPQSLTKIAPRKRAPARGPMMKRLTTVHVSTQRGWHGGEGQARLLVRGLLAREHRCVIFARDGGEFAERMEGEGFEVERIGGSGRGIRAMLHTRRLLRELRPDVIHFHDPHALERRGHGSMAIADRGADRLTAR